MVRISLRLLRWKIKLRGHLEDLRDLHILPEKIGKIVGIASFPVLSATAMGLLRYQRFSAAIILYSLGCISLALSTLVWFSSVKHAVWEWAFILMTDVGILLLMPYLMGVVGQAQTEYYPAKIKEDARASKETLDKWRDSQPAFVKVFPIVFDPVQQRQWFYVAWSWKPLTNVQITLVDNLAALARKSRTTMQITFPEVSSSYLTNTFYWDKPAPNPVLDDNYTIDAASHEGGNYSEYLQIHHYPDGKQIVRIEILGVKKDNKPVFFCEDFPGFNQERKDVPHCQRP
jgi:multisubunit Na+/H+ antiporter MnhG subunit